MTRCPSLMPRADRSSISNIVRNQWRSDCPNKAASPTVLHIWDMQLGSTVFGVQRRLRCQSEAAATKPQRKVWAESGRNEDQNGACSCTNAGSHMHKRSIYTKIPAVHSVMVITAASTAELPPGFLLLSFRSAGWWKGHGYESAGSGLVQKQDFHSF